MSSHGSAGTGNDAPTHWTVQVMPDGGGRIRTIRISRRVVRLAGVTAVVFGLVMAAFLVSLGLDAAREVELVRLRLENRHLTQNLTKVESQVGTLASSVDDLSKQEQKFRLLAGLPDLDEEVRAVGVGGPLPAAAEREEFLATSPQLAERTYATAYDADLLMRRLDLLGSSIEEAQDSVELHREVFLARPSIRPVQAEESWISSSFSRSRMHPVLQVNRPHPGIDISALAGTPILASAAGTVTYAGTRAGYGKTVEIDHGFGYKTRYAHAGSIQVKRGQRVARGDVLGEVGKTGLATAPHLHYEVLIDGRQVNPKEYLLDDIVYE
ncbi:MAG: M23 family metallopeptidase [Candidatus Palauibacterales bacterium]|jgi:murein DD-endopeptidase MepM/ murein hydrolase activator NlpD|nr:M23 family metallopeptidase [Candidatus Palauibacterales bacterium]